MVHEVFKGKTVWQGEVEVFSMPNHPAKTFYAWTYEDDSGQEILAAVAGTPPIRTALDAVRAHIVGEVKKQKAN
jgi:hypothetical protein